MTIEITHTRREGTLIEGTSRGDGSAEILRLREYGRTQSQPFRWSRNLDCWYLPHSRDHATYTPSLELLAQRLRDAGFEVTLTIDNADRRSFSDAEKEREERAEGRAERFGGYAASAAQNSEAAWKSSHEISERFAFGQPILIGHHSEGRARRDHARMDNAMRKSIGESDRAAQWTGRAQAAANYERFKKDPGRTLRRLDKLRADLRAVEKWQRGESAKGFSTQLLERPATITVPDTEAGRLIVPATEGSTTVPTYRVGAPDIQCRYPVIVGEDQVIGRAYRLHRDWLVLTTEGERNLRRPPKGTPGTDVAAAHLAEEYAAGRIGAVPWTRCSPRPPRRCAGRCLSCTRGCRSTIATPRARRSRSRDSGPTTGGQCSPGSPAEITTRSSAANCVTDKARSSGATCADAMESRRARAATRAGASERKGSAD